MEKRVKRIERICITGIAVLATVAGVGVCMLLFPAASPDDARQTQDAEQRFPAGQSAQPAQDDAGESGAQLARRTDYLPDGVLYGGRLPVTQFIAADGSVRSLDDYRGKTLMLMFWGSWCPYCDRALEHSDEFARVLEEYPQVQLLLIDKLDEGKGETVEKAQEHLARLGVPFESLYDEGLRAVEAYGLKQIPTVLVLDEDGYLRAMTTQAPNSGEELRTLLDDALSGGGESTLRFVCEKLTGEDGGIYTTLVPGGDSPTGKDVLSESQGIMMRVALQMDDQELFEKSYRCARERLAREGVFCWYARQEGEQAGANALIDDLRIYAALRDAGARWGSYREEAAALAQAIWDHNVVKGHPVGYYDFSQGRAGNALPLCYIDLRALRLLADDVPAFAAVADEAERVLSEGMISDAFPLYYASYDFDTKRYGTQSLNTAEALMALYHAVCAGVAPRRAIDWLAERVAAGTLAARYDVNGEPVRGFDYDSTAAYAIAALIGAEAQDARLYTAARNRMEKYHVTEAGALKGSFCDRADGSDIIAFDQLLPLLVYTGTKDVVLEPQG